jgi:hypothetical protein
MEIKMIGKTLKVGTPTFIPQDSPNSHYSAYFEDDGETGYFYAVDLSAQLKILDAVHIYNVRDVVDLNRPSQVTIVWSEDGSKCALFINDYPHAAFDFSRKRGYCRTNFPYFNEPDDAGWMTSDHSWSDEAISWLA